MSNKNKNNTPNNTPSPAPAPAPAPAEAPAAEAPVSAAAPATELAVAPPSGVDVPVDNLMKRFGQHLPEDDKRYLAQLRTPSDDELGQAVRALDPSKRDAFLSALDRLNPVQIGRHGRKGDFTLPDIRLFHGTGKDEMRPSATPIGGIYSNDGRILCAPKGALKDLRANPAYKNVSDSFPVYLVGFHEANTFWPPRDGTIPEGAENVMRPGQNVPLCRSVNRKRGDVFGDCATCVYAPFKNDKPNKNGCRQEHHLYVVPADFSGLYRFVVNGTSIKPGSAPMYRKSKPWAAMWSQPFDLETREDTDDNGNRWFQLFSSTSSNAAPPTAEEFELLKLLAIRVDLEIFFPALSRAYDPHKASHAAAQPVAKDVSDMMANAPGAPPKADYSKSNL